MAFKSANLPLWRCSFMACASVWRPRAANYRAPLQGARKNLICTKIRTESSHPLPTHATPRVQLFSPHKCAPLQRVQRSAASAPLQFFSRAKHYKKFIGEWGVMKVCSRRQIMVNFGYFEHLQRLIMLIKMYLSLLFKFGWDSINCLKKLTLKLEIFNN